MIGRIIGIVIDNRKPQRNKESLEIIDNIVWDRVTQKTSCILIISTSVCKVKESLSRVWYIKEGGNEDEKNSM